MDKVDVVIPASSTPSGQLQNIFSDDDVLQGNRILRATILEVTGVSIGIDPTASVDITVMDDESESWPLSSRIQKARPHISY